MSGASTSTTTPTEEHGTFVYRVGELVYYLHARDQNPEGYRIVSRFVRRGKRHYRLAGAFYIRAHDSGNIFAEDDLISRREVDVILEPWSPEESELVLDDLFDDSEGVESNKENVRPTSASTFANRLDNNTNN